MPLFLFFQHTKDAHWTQQHCCDFLKTLLYTGGIRTLVFCSWKIVGSLNSSNGYWAEMILITKIGRVIEYRQVNG
jgi:hypothetical protein